MLAIVQNLKFLSSGPILDLVFEIFSLVGIGALCPYFFNLRENHGLVVINHGFSSYVKLNGAGKNYTLQIPAFRNKILNGMRM